VLTLRPIDPYYEARRRTKWTTNLPPMDSKSYVHLTIKVNLPSDWIDRWPATSADLEIMKVVRDTTRAAVKAAKAPVEFSAPTLAESRPTRPQHVPTAPSVDVASTGGDATTTDYDECLSCQ
jgi:hypothetical protein